MSELILGLGISWTSDCLEEVCRHTKTRRPASEWQLRVCWHKFRLQSRIWRTAPEGRRLLVLTRMIPQVWWWFNFVLFTKLVGLSANVTICDISFANLIAKILANFYFVTISKHPWASFKSGGTLGLVCFSARDILGLSVRITEVILSIGVNCVVNLTRNCREMVQHLSLKVTFSTDYNSSASF